jgi:hypothetical protein
VHRAVGSTSSLAFRPGVAWRMEASATTSTNRPNRSARWIVVRRRGWPSRTPLSVSPYRRGGLQSREGEAPAEPAGATVPAWWTSISGGRGSCRASPAGSAGASPSLFLDSSSQKALQERGREHEGRVARQGLNLDNTELSPSARAEPGPRRLNSP